MAKRTQETNGGQAAETNIKGAPDLDDLIQQGARRIIQQAIEAELATMLEQYSNVEAIDGRRVVVHNGYLPAREIVTATTVQVPKVRDRSGSGVKFNSAIVPPYVRQSPRVSSSLPWLYLRGVWTCDMGEAFSALLGEQVKELWANLVSRLKATWADEYEQWNKRDLSAARSVYWWADGIYTQARTEDSDGQYLLVIAAGDKERVALNDGYRKSKQPWRELMLDLKKGVSAAQASGREELAHGRNVRPDQRCHLARFKDTNTSRERPIRIRQSKYLNNIVGQDRCAIKLRIRSMIGFKDFHGARILFGDIEDNAHDWQRTDEGRPQEPNT